MLVLALIIVVGGWEELGNEEPQFLIGTEMRPHHHTGHRGCLPLPAVHGVPANFQPM